MKQLMIKALPYVKPFVSGTALGVLAVVLLIWFGARFVGVTSQSTRLILVGFVLALYVVWIVVKHLVLVNKSNKIENDLSSENNNRIQTKLNAVMASLKQSDIGRRYRGNAALYALPWYMIIGPSAAGKSTLFSRSGLSFPLKDDERYHIEGIGGTKDCDWWFSDEAILIDTAGRYTNTQNNTEWLGFLDTLKKNRPKAPLNGVILAFPLDELLTSSEEQVEQHLSHIKNRLNEINQKLGLMVPIYLVVTKCDMLKGFSSFFEDLSDSEVNQPWGVYLLEDTEDKTVDSVSVFSERIRALYFRLLEQRTQKMSQTQNAQKKSEIYQFPSQFNAVTHRLTEFLNQLVKDNPYHERPWFAGVYFSSSTQDGDLVERKSNAIRDVFLRVKQTVLKKPTEVRSYFIKNFFTQVVFPLKDAVRGNRKQQKLHRLAKGAMFVGCALVSVVLVLLLSGTYSANKQLLKSYERTAVQLVERLENRNSSEIDKFDALVGLFNHYESLKEIETYSPLHLITQYDLVGTHGEPVRNLLVSTVERYMLNQVEPAFFNRLENHISEWDTLTTAQQSVERPGYYQTLKVYLELTSHHKHYKREDVVNLLAEIWFDSFSDDRLKLSYDQQVETLQKLTAMYLQFNYEQLDALMVNPWNKGAAIAQSAQLHLATPPNADILYEYLLNEAQANFKDETLSSLTEGVSSTVLVSAAKIPGAYTKLAWDTYVNQSIEELSELATAGDWVLGTGESYSNDVDRERFKRQIRNQIRTLYFSDYSNAWRSLLTEATVLKQSTLSGNVNTLKVLSDQKGPLARLLNTLRDNLQIHERNLISNSTVASETSETQLEVPTLSLPVIEAFELQAYDLLAIVTDENESGSIDSFEEISQEWLKVYSDLETLSAAANQGVMSKAYAADILSGKTSNKSLYSSWINIKNILDNHPNEESELLSRIYTQPLIVAWRSVLKESENALQNSWKVKVYDAYSATLLGKYPFYLQGKDAAVVDFDALMKPNEGSLWSFVDEELGAFILKDNATWRARTWLGYGLSINPSMYSSLVSADRMAKSLYNSSGQAQMRYWIYPIAVPGISESTFSVDNDKYHYRNEPQEWREFSWSLYASQKALLSLRSNGAQTSNEVEFDGPWSLIRLVRQAEVSHIQGSEFAMEWTVKSQSGESVIGRFRLKADRVGSLFNPKLMNGLSFPKQLIKG